MNKAQRVVLLVTATVIAVLLCYGGVLHATSPFRPDYTSTDANGDRTVVTAIVAAICMERGIWMFVVAAAALGGALVAVLHNRR